jgi:hypothetical protein
MDLGSNPETKNAIEPDSRIETESHFAILHPYQFTNTTKPQKKQEEFRDTNFTVPTMTKMAMGFLKPESISILLLFGGRIYPIG